MIYLSCTYKNICVTKTKQVYTRTFSGSIYSTVYTDRVSIFCVGNIPPTVHHLLYTGMFMYKLYYNANKVMYGIKHYLLFFVYVYRMLSILYYDLPWKGVRTCTTNITRTRSTPVTHATALSILLFGFNVFLLRGTVPFLVYA